MKEQEISKALLAKVRKLGKFGKDEKDTKAIEAYIRENPQLRILELEGKVNYFDDYDYKALRGKRRADES